MNDCSNGIHTQSVFLPASVYLSLSHTQSLPSAVSNLSHIYKCKSRLRGSCGQQSWSPCMDITSDLTVSATLILPHKHNSCDLNSLTLSKTDNPLVSRTHTLRVMF